MVKMVQIDKFNQTIRNVKSKLDDASSEIDKINSYYKKFDDESLSKKELKNLKYLNKINNLIFKINDKMKLQK